MKATHFGHCQVCGSRQKLPGGQLSKHGYTLKWGFFSGTCNGAGELPFELSKDLIDDAITRAQKMADDWKVKIHQLTTDKKSEKVWIFERRSLGHGHVEKEWRELLRSDFKFGYFTEWTQKDGKTGKANVYGVLSGAADDYVIALNKHRADFLRGKLKQVEEYIRWQQERVKDWKPTPLDPVDPEDKAPVMRRMKP